MEPKPRDLQDLYIVTLRDVRTGGGTVKTSVLADNRPTALRRAQEVGPEYHWAERSEGVEVISLG